MFKSFRNKRKRVVLFLASILISLGIISMIICISNPLLATVFFSAKSDYQITHVRGDGEDTYTVKKKKILDLFIGKKIVRDDSLKELGDTNGTTLYLIHLKGDKNIVYYDSAPSDAVVCYQGKYYRITNPEYPISISTLATSQ